MQSRMDKYNYEVNGTRSRCEKNKDLYEYVRNSSLTDFDVNSNVSILDDNHDVVNVTRLKSLLDNKYQQNEKRHRIEVPDYMDDEEPMETEYDTKEYDINAIISKAKQGKTVDYNKERLKRAQEAQLEILNKLDLSMKDKDNGYNEKREQEENNLIELINTITHIEQINKNRYSKEVSGAMELLGFGENSNEEASNETKEESTVVNEIRQEIGTEEKEETEEVATVSDVNEDTNEYYDFEDISKRDKSAIFIKIVIFVIIVCLIAGGIYILNNLLNLGLF